MIEAFELGVAKLMPTASMLEKPHGGALFRENTT